jgi:hypothetical protein
MPCHALAPRPVHDHSPHFAIAKTMPDAQKPGRPLLVNP